jgi:urease accessory protein
MARQWSRVSSRSGSAKNPNDNLRAAKSHKFCATGTKDGLISGTAFQTRVLVTQPKRWSLKIARDAYIADLAPDQSPDRTAPQRARGTARLVCHAKDGASRIATLHQQGALKLLFPRPKRGLDAVMINTSGGVTGGDQLRVDAAAERAYRAHPGETAEITTTLHVETDARLHWMPQEMILFDSCALSRKLHVTLEPGAEFLGVEPIVFGRTARGEELRSGLFHDEISIDLQDGDRFIDRTRFQGDIAARLDRPAIANGARAVATVLYAGPKTERLLDLCRRALEPATGGASLLPSGLLVVRILAQDGFDLRTSLVPLLKQMTGHPLPACWRL